MFERSMAAVRRRARPVPRDETLDDPYVCLLYESKEERDELSRLLQEAGLDVVPWQFVDVQTAKRPGLRLRTLQRSFRRIPHSLEAGSVASLAVLSSHWPVVAVLVLSLAPLLLVLRLMRGLGPSRVTAAG
jgi:hypothetical protein